VEIVNLFEEMKPAVLSQRCY